jgi:tetratricopeptide (TPR) repeat protein
MTGAAMVERARISVVVRSMNRPTLGAALESIAAQDFAGVEVVVVAASGASHPAIDGSPHGLQVRNVPSAEPLDRPAAANAGLLAAAGRRITYLDDDDTLLPGHFAGLWQALEEHRDAGAAYCRFEVYANGAVTTVMGRPFNRIALHERNFVHLSSLLFDRKLVDQGVRFDPEFKSYQDWDFVLQLAERTRFVFVPQATFRWHADLGASGAGGFANFDSELYRTYEARRNEKWSAVHGSLVERFNGANDRALEAIRGNRLDEAQEALRTALEVCPDDADVLNLMSMVAYRQGLIAEARRHIGEALALRADDARLWFNCGLVAAAGKATAEAKNAFGKALALQPDHTAAAQWLDRIANEEAAHR